MASARKILVVSEIRSAILSCAGTRKKALKVFNQFYENAARWNSLESIPFLEAAMKQLDEKIKLLEGMLNDVVTDLASQRNPKSELIDLKSFLEVELDELKNNVINKLKISLLERELALLPLPLECEAQASNYYAYFKSNYLQLTNTASSSKLSLKDIFNMLVILSNIGMAGSAGRGFCRIVCQEMIRRVTYLEVDVEDPDVMKIIRYFEHEKPMYDLYLSAATQCQFAPKAEAFKKAYYELRDSQFGFFCIKTDFLDGKEALLPHELIEIVVKYSCFYPASRTAEAWHWAQAHFRDGMPKNSDCSEVIKYAKLC
jgi:hypothetical protein